MDERYIIFGACIATFTGAWVMVDASRRGASGIGAFALGLFTLLFCCAGLPLWLVLRLDLPEKVVPIRCSHCNQWTEGNEPVCRSCGGLISGESMQLLDPNERPWPHVVRGDPHVERQRGCYDVYAQNLPKGATKLDDIPNGFRPIQLFDRKDMINVIRRVIPNADFSMPGSIVFALPTAKVTIHMTDDPVFVCHFVVEGGVDGVEVVGRVLKEMKVPAINGIDNDIFWPQDTLTAYNRWLARREAEKANET